MSLQLSAVSFYNSADAVQTKAIMSLFDIAQRFPPPILGIRRETGLWFIKAEEEPAIADSGFSNQCALATVMLESIGEKFHKYLLEQLRINIQHPIMKLHVPRDLVAFF